MTDSSLTAANKPLEVNGDLYNSLQKMLVKFNL